MNIGAVFAQNKGRIGDQRCVGPVYGQQPKAAFAGKVEITFVRGFAEYRIGMHGCAPGIWLMFGLAEAAMLCKMRIRQIRSVLKRRAGHHT